MLISNSEINSKEKRQFDDKSFDKILCNDEFFYEYTPLGGPQLFVYRLEAHVSNIIIIIHRLLGSLEPFVIWTIIKQDRITKFS